MFKALPCQNSPVDSRPGTLCYGAKSCVISLAGFFVAGYTGVLSMVSGSSTGALLRISLVQAGQV